MPLDEYKRKRDFTTFRGRQELALAHTDLGDHVVRAEAGAGLQGHSCPDRLIIGGFRAERHPPPGQRRFATLRHYWMREKTGSYGAGTGRSVRRHQPPQFLESVLDDDDLRQFGPPSSRARRGRDGRSAETNCLLSTLRSRRQAWL